MPSVLVATVGAKVLGFLLKLVSPLIKDLLQTSIRALHAKAKATANPIDDVFTGLLAKILDVSVSDVVADAPGGEEFKQDVTTFLEDLNRVFEQQGGGA